mgnify:CR=1 FL=1
MSTAAPDLRPWPVYRRLLGYALPYRPVFLVALLGLVLGVAAEVGLAAITKPLTDETFINHNPEAIRTIPLMILGLFLLRGVANFTSGYSMAWIARNVTRDLRGQLFGHLLRLPVRYYDRNTSGTLISRLIFNIEQIADACTTALTAIVQETLLVIGLLGYMFWLNWQLTLFTLVVAPLIAVLVRTVGVRFRLISARIQKNVGTVTQTADEAFGAHRVIKIQNGQALEDREFAKVNNHDRYLRMKMTATQLASTAITQFIAACSLAGLVYFASRPGVLETITPGTFVSFLLATARLLTPIKHLTTINERLQRGIAAGTDIFQLMAEAVEPVGGTRRLKRAEGRIEFRDVTFRYNPDLPEVLHGLSVNVKPGQTVAFVGKSGSGKSTLLSLVPRFYDPDQGQILLDGHDLRDYVLGDLRQQIALVDQQVRLFNASVAENIAYGIEPMPEEARLIEAARHANAWEFIEKLPQGIHTIVGQNGVMLSGGQRQRIVIARALLKNAPILILDEATSALDSESERSIQQAIEKLVAGRTTLVIAHRLSTIQNADQIVVMHDGRIVESGGHAELLARNGHYAALHKMQFQDA